MYVLQMKKKRRKKCKIKELKKIYEKREGILSSIKDSNYSKSLTPAFLFVGFVVRFLTCEYWKNICLWLCCTYLTIHKKTRNQTQQKCEIKIQNIYFQLTFVSTIYPNGYFIRSKKYDTE